MKFLICVLMLMGIFVLGKKLLYEYKTVEREQSGQRQKARPADVNAVLPGLPPQYEPSLERARQQGVGGLREWLKAYRYVVADPRLADIELDCVILLNRQDPAAARELFHAVKARVPPSSPVYPRVKSLEKAYQ